MKRVGLYVIIFLLIGVVTYLYIRLDKSDNDIETLNNANKTLLKENDSLLLLEQENALKVDLLTLKVDSLILSDSVHKKQLKLINKKYAKLKNTYDNLPDSDKWDAFDQLANE